MLKEASASQRRPGGWEEGGARSPAHAGRSPSHAPPPRQGHTPGRVLTTFWLVLTLAQAGLSVIKESEAQLWWAAKELRRTKKLSDYVGKNEKTKIIVKIQQVSTLMCHC